MGLTDKNRLGGPIYPGRHFPGGWVSREMDFPGNPPVSSPGIMRMAPPRFPENSPGNFPAAHPNFPGVSRGAPPAAVSRRISRDMPNIPRGIWMGSQVSRMGGFPPVRPILFLKSLGFYTQKSLRSITNISTCGVSGGFVCRCAILSRIIDWRWVLLEFLNSRYYFW